ncbi:MAG: hypothetical protein KC910_28755 [Candidatus Eremiobacteraeota bacterium]|nr:hypothetical protein [Candidatus Eremiobacteraeota bacterium]
MTIPNSALATINAFKQNHALPNQRQRVELSAADADKYRGAVERQLDQFASWDNNDRDLDRSFGSMRFPMEGTNACSSIELKQTENGREAYSYLSDEQGLYFDNGVGYMSSENGEFTQLIVNGDGASAVYVGPEGAWMVSN